MSDDINEGLQKSMQAQYEDEVRRLAELLGGGWKFDQGLMPLVVLTVSEAQKLEQRLVEFEQIQECLVDPDERRPGRTYERVQELLAEVKSLQARVPNERLQTAIDAFQEYEQAGWIMVALPGDMAS